MASRLLLPVTNISPFVSRHYRLVQSPLASFHSTRSQLSTKDEQPKARVPERGQPIDTSYNEADEARKKYETSPATRRLNRYMFDQVEINKGKLPGYHINAEYDLIRKEKKGKLADQPTWFEDPNKPKRNPFLDSSDEH